MSDDPITLLLFPLRLFLAGQRAPDRWVLLRKPEQPAEDAETYLTNDAAQMCIPGSGDPPQMTVGDCATSRMGTLRSG